ncbi:PQQ-dependent sugar dehydrogenase [Agromyces sp. MMS24-JH15]|uniref:PQQ-dependent sugar dehydrogenase n=1 Tax=Agromyces sp. MMS24-JH15 TaxID=3243765 RepID=UPI00374A125C
MRGRGLVAVTALAAGALVLAGTPAYAHNGVDHGAEAAAAAATNWSNYEKVLITKDVGEPIDLAVLPDSRVLHTARNGDLRITDPSTGVTKIVNTVEVYSNSEDGLQTVALDPDFATNHWVYLVYAPRDANKDGVVDTPTGSAPERLPAGADEATYWNQWIGVNRLSRFQWTGDKIDLATEQVILDVTVNRGQCCHVGADIDFDAAGNLYLSTGDNTPASTPGANGFAPNNDAPGMNPGLDSRRGAGNTNDLRGKILRIHPEANGSYTIPAGNLFAPGTPKTRPEIFIMGVRNPFRLDVDSENNSITWGDYGPDATKAVASTAGRGPMGLVEWNTVALNDPHNGGWPYMTGDNFVYNDWNYETSTPGPFFDAANLINDSRWNTGLTQLPAPRPATVYYGDNVGDQPAAFDDFVNLGSGTGQAPMGGPVYHYDAANPSPTKFPQYWDDKAFFAEFSQDFLAALTVDWNTHKVTHVQDFLPNSALTAAAQPIHDNAMDLEFGPDGSLYVLEYGDGFFRANPDNGLYRIDYVEGDKRPQARFTATPGSSSTAPVTVTFDGSASTDPEGSALTYDWDVNGDGTFEYTGKTATHTYANLGAYTARLRVTDAAGRISLTSKVVSVGNQAPAVTIDYPANGGFYDWGQAVPYKVTTADAEDGSATTCTRVAWTYGLGHDEHAHPEVSGTGCQGAWLTNASSPEHGAGANLYGAVVVTYTDNGANGLPAASGEASVRLNPKKQQAELATQREGVVVYEDASASGGSAVRGLGSGDYLRYDPVSFSGITGAVVRANGGGNVALRWGSVSAAPFATAAIPAGDGWKDVQVNFTAPSGSGQLFVTSTAELAVDSITMVGAGVADVTAPTVAHTLTPSTPKGVGGVFNEPVRFAVQPTDNGALSTVQYSTNGGQTWTNLAANQQYGVTFSTKGTYNLSYRATDTGGNVSQVKTVSFSVDLAALNAPTVDSQTLVALGSSRSSFGDSADVAVQVTGAGGVPTGVVSLTIGETEVGRGTLDAQGRVTIALPADLAVGTHTVRATYLADQVFKTSAGTARLTVAQTKSLTSVSVSPDPVKPAVAAKAAIAVESTTGIVPVGDVTVKVLKGTSTVATLTGTLDASGQVVVTLPKLASGSYQIQASYDGSAGVAKSTDTVSLTVRA